MDRTNLRIVGKQVPGVKRTVYGEWFHVDPRDKKKMAAIRTELTLIRALEPEAEAVLQTRGAGPWNRFVGPPHVVESDWHDFQF